MFDFIKTLVPHLDKNNVLEDLRITSKELTDTLIPCFASAVDVFNANKITSASNKELGTVFFRNYDSAKSSKTPSFVHEINSKLVNVKRNLAYLESQIKVLFSRDILSEGLTAKKAILLRAAENMSFLTRYAGDLLNLVYINEGRNIASKTESEVEGMLPIVEARITKNISAFAKALSQAGTKPEEFTAAIGKIPDVYVSPEASGFLGSVYGIFSLDPFMLNSHSKGFIGNPLYHFGLMIAEWQVNRVKQDIEKKKSLELRKMHLELMHSNTGDPALEKQISILQERIDALEFKIRKVEEDAGVTND